MADKFPPPQPFYHPETALWMARLAGMAYRNGCDTCDEWAVRIGNLARAAGFTRVHFFHNSKAFLAVNDRFAVLSICGTEDLVGWIKNLRTDKVSWHQGEVHEGFSELTQALQQQLDEIDDIAVPIYFTGHSQGGAVALLLAAGFERDGEGHRVGGVYTFGQPRVGDSRFADWVSAYLGDRIYRHVKCADAVPRLPGFMQSHIKALILAGSAWVPILALILFWPAGFKHAGVLIYGDRNNRLHRNSSIWYRCWDRICATVSDLFTWGLRSVKDHCQAGSYIKMLEANVPEGYR